MEGTSHMSKRFWSCIWGPVLGNTVAFVEKEMLLKSRLEKNLNMGQQMAAIAQVPCAKGAWASIQKRKKH